MSELDRFAQIEDTVVDKLNRLADAEAHRTVLELRKQEAIDLAVPEEVKAVIARINADFDTQIGYADHLIGSLREEVKEDTLELCHTVRGDRKMAVWNSPRVTWDGKGLQGYAVANPEIKAFMKVGRPTVTIRVNKKGR